MRFKMHRILIINMQIYINILQYSLAVKYMFIIKMHDVQYFIKTKDLFIFSGNGKMFLYEENEDEHLHLNEIV